LVNLSHDKFIGVYNKTPRSRSSLQGRKVRKLAKGLEEAARHTAEYFTPREVEEDSTIPKEPSEEILLILGC